MTLDAPLPFSPTESDIQPGYVRAPNVQARANRAMSPRFSVRESYALRGGLDVAMVCLLGGGPRLALRAARLLIEERKA